MAAAVFAIADKLDSPGVRECTVPRVHAFAIRTLKWAVVSTRRLGTPGQLGEHLVGKGTACFFSQCRQFLYVLARTRLLLEFRWQTFDEILVVHDPAPLVSTALFRCVARHLTFPFISLYGVGTLSSHALGGTNLNTAARLTMLFSRMPLVSRPCRSVLAVPRAIPKRSPYCFTVTV